MLPVTTSVSKKRQQKWHDLETFTQEGTDLAVRVQASDDERPILSWQTGRVREGRFMPHHRNRCRTEKGWVTVERIDFGALAQIAERAQDFIERHMQQRETASQ